MLCGLPLVHRETENANGSILSRRPATQKRKNLRCFSHADQIKALVTSVKPVSTQCPSTATEVFERHYLVGVRGRRRHHKDVPSCVDYSACPKSGNGAHKSFCEKEVTIFSSLVFFVQFQTRIPGIIGQRIGSESSGFASIFPECDSKISTFLDFDFAVEIGIFR